MKLFICNCPNSISANTESVHFWRNPKSRKMHQSIWQPVLTCFCARVCCDSSHTFLNIYKANFEQFHLFDFTPHCVFPSVSSNELLERMYNCTGCISLTFLHCLFLFPLLDPGHWPCFVVPYLDPSPTPKKRCPLIKSGFKLRKRNYDKLVDFVWGVKKGNQIDQLCSRQN